MNAQSLFKKSAAVYRQLKKSAANAKSFNINYENIIGYMPGFRACPLMPL
jgi:hypothetical protein